MLSVNSVLVPADNDIEPTFKTNMLVVYIDRQSRQACLLPLDKNRNLKPKPYPFKQIENFVETKVVTTAKLAIPTLHLSDDSSLKDSRIIKRDERYQIILPIINDLRSYLFPRYGHSIIAREAQRRGVQPTAIVRLMNMWFFGGQTINALLGDYSQVGIASPGESAQKVGAKRKNTPFTGRSFTEDDEKKLGRCLNKHVLTRDAEIQKSLQGAYEELLGTQYSTVHVTPHGKKAVTVWQDDNIPSIHQFYYHAKKYFKKTDKYPDQFKVKVTVFKKDYAARTGTIERIDRPGEQYQIDETPFDAALIADKYSTTGHCVGNATLYIVCDVNSHVIVGIYITLNPPSWESMRQALLNAFLPKVEFCQKYGITIDEGDWPHGVCDELLGDNAELTAGMSQVLEQQFNCSVRFTRAGQGDDKGLVERVFSALKTDLIGKIPGFSFSNQNEKGLTESRYRALLNIDDLHKILINLVLFRNENTELSYDKLDRDMCKDNVIPTPLELWRWGCRERGGPKIYSRNYIESRLMSKGMASIRRNGVYFKGLWYNCEHTLNTGMQDRKPAGNKSPKVTCLFDRNTADAITLFINGKFYPAYLQEKSRRFTGVTFDEVEMEINAEKYAVNSRAPARRSAKAMLNSEISDIVTAAKEKTPKIVKAERRRQNISANRKIEADRENALLADAANRRFRENSVPEKSNSEFPPSDLPQYKSQKNISQALDSLFSGDDDD